MQPESKTCSHCRSGWRCEENAGQTKPSAKAREPVPQIASEPYIDAQVHVKYCTEARPNFVEFVAMRTGKQSVFSGQGSCGLREFRLLRFGELCRPRGAALFLRGGGIGR